MTKDTSLSTADKLYRARLKLIEYQIDKLQSRLKYYESIGNILSASIDVRRARVGRVLSSLVDDVNSRTSGIQSVVEDLKKQQT